MNEILLEVVSATSNFLVFLLMKKNVPSACFPEQIEQKNPPLISVCFFFWLSWLSSFQLFFYQSANVNHHFALLYLGFILYFFLGLSFSDERRIRRYSRFFGLYFSHLFFGLSVDILKDRLQCTFVFACSWRMVYRKQPLWTRPSAYTGAILKTNTKVTL